jgi:hypothetical protein
MPQANTQTTRLADLPLDLVGNIWRRKAPRRSNTSEPACRHVAGQNRARAWGTQKVNNNKPSAQNKQREGDALLSELATPAQNTQQL